MFYERSVNKYFYVIIIVDDDAISNFITKSIIDKADFYKTIYSFTDQEDALTFFKEREMVYNEKLIDFIFLDVKMPVSDGFMFLDKLNELNLSITAEVKVIMLSNLISPEDRQRSIKYKQIVQLVEKPLTEEVLQKIIKGAIH